MRWLLIILILISSCTKTLETPYSGDHKTSQIREMWTICFFTSARNTPYTPKQLHVNFCDCLIDKSREKYSVNDYEKIDNLSMAFTNFSIECNLNNTSGTTPIPTPKLPSTL